MSAPALVQLDDWPLEMTPEQLSTAFRWCLGVFLCGIPGTLFYLVMRSRHDSSWFRERLYVMRARIVASGFLLGLGFIGMILTGGLLAIR